MPPALIGYCTNVHAGASLDACWRNLEEHAVAVRRLWDADRPMGVGLWLSAATARSLLGDQRLAEFAAWLGEQQFTPFTFNGFPHGDFHQAVVKHRVYQPNWMDDERVRYTRDLIDIQAALMNEATYGSISTLPLAWGAPRATDEQEQAAAARLAEVAGRLAEVEQDTGKRIVLSIEPEPGCLLSTSGDLVRFFEQRLFRTGVAESILRRYLGVCHDVCHAVVMGESQADALARYAAAGVVVGKVQISSAVVVDFDALADDAERAAALDQLAEFSEDRYLHQVGVLAESGGLERFFEDLPPAIQWARSQGKLAGRWAVHFHVPVYLERFGRLAASRSAIDDCLAALPAESESPIHFEVETYAWNVLPAELQKPRLAEGIAEELRWFEQRLTPC